MKKLIVDCGISGAALARLLAERGEKVTIIDSKNHVAGNIYDYYSDGICVHKYGTHIFHTNNKEVWGFVSRFCKWYPYQHRVVSGRVPVYVFRDKKDNKIMDIMKLYCFKDQPNFGDLLNGYIFEKIFNIKIELSDILNSDFVGIGSLFEFLFSRHNHFIKRVFYKPIKIFGTGFIKQAETEMLYYPKRKMKIYAVRGYLTYERLLKYGLVKPSDNIAIGDPGLLVSKLIDTSKIKKKYDLGIIPHYVDKNSPLLDNIKVKNSVILDITKNPIDLLHDIAECKVIISSAMHGLIAADSLGIPNMRIILSDKITGGDYKYDDYYSAFGIKKHNRIDLRVSSFTEKDLKELCDNYQIKQSQVHQKQIELFNAFPYKTRKKTCL